MDATITKVAKKLVCNSPHLSQGGLPVKLDPSAFVADPELIKALEAKATCVQYGQDSVLFRQGGAPIGLYVVNKGAATLVMHSPAGEEVMAVQAGAGSLLGLPGLIGNEPYTLTAIANAGAELYFIGRGEFTTLMRTDPQLALKVLQVLAAEVRSAREAIREL